MEKSNDHECSAQSQGPQGRATGELCSVICPLDRRGERLTCEAVSKQKIDYIDKAPTSDDIEFIRRLPLTEEQLLKLIQQIPNRSSVTNEN